MRRGGRRQTSKYARVYAYAFIIQYLFMVALYHISKQLPYGEKLGAGKFGKCLWIHQVLIIQMFCYDKFP